MAPTDGRVAKPERRWGCRCSTPLNYRKVSSLQHSNIHDSQQHVAGE